MDILGELPLAIEVTAAYAARQRLSLPRVLDELREDRLDATALNQADPNRRMYLRFDRSWQALEPAEQRLFAGLSLLVGASFPRDAARALEAAARAPTPAAGPAGELAALVAYALVEPLANDRLRLHPLLREYAAAKLRDLGPAVESPLGDALLAYWLAYARAHRGLDGLDALENEAPGLMGALEWARRHGRERTVPALTEIVASMEQTRGRRAELAALIRALHDEDDPIGAFALQGMAGVGKTSLARLAMAQLSEDRAAFPGGAVWISAEGLAGPDGLSELWSRVARALGQDKVAAIPAVETRRVALAAAISARPRTLLALDNVEPGLDAYAVLDVLAIRGHTALLLIARQSVAPDRLPAITLLSLPVSAAVDIFRRRLAQVDPSRPTTDDDAHIPGLVEAVGRLPLTIELLAGYAGVQKRPIATLATELAQGGTTAAFRADPRRTLVGSFDRSWDALLPRQRRLFAGLSLLEGASFPRAAALALAQAAPDLGKAADPEADLAVLVAYALVEPLADGRLHLHPLLREYAAAKLRDDLGPAAVAHYREALRRFEQVQSPDAETMRAALRRLGAEP